MNASDIVKGAKFELGGLGIYEVEIVNDAGTERIRHIYNGALIRDVTPAGGHVEDHQAETLPAGYEAS